MRSLELVLASVLLSIPLCATGCTGDDLSGPGTGTLQVTTTPGGDPDGYTVQIDNAEPRPVAAGGTIEQTGLTSGDHLVTLGGVAANCSVSGENPRTARMSPGSTAVITFQVACSSLLGSLEISTTTTGESLDPDGYAIIVDGSAFPTTMRRVETLQVPGLSPGEHTVELVAVAPNCTPAEGSRQSAVVGTSATAKIHFTVRCSFIGITIWTSIPLPPSLKPVVGWGGGRTLWANSPSDLFVLSRVQEPNTLRYSIWHYDGSAWTEQVHRINTVIAGLWGFSSTDVYAVGNSTGEDEQKGLIFHYDGASWSEKPGPVPGKVGVFTGMSGIWGPGTGDVFVSGSSVDLSHTDAEFGLLGHFDGRSWSRMATPVFGEWTRLPVMAGTSGSDVWAIGSRLACVDCSYSVGMIVHYDGQAWTESFHRESEHLQRHLGHGSERCLGGRPGRRHARRQRAPL